mgnify:CR=1 FL=1
MANEFRVKNGLIVSGNATVSGIVLDGNTITGVDDSGEFTDNDAHIMTSAGINDKFGVIAGSTSIVTVGTITTGTWQATDIGVAHGGTGVSTLGTNAVLIGNGTSAITSSTNLTFDDTDLSLAGAGKLEFRDTAIYIHSDADGYLESVADTGISFKIGSTEQIILTDGALSPTTDNDIDLGSSGAGFKQIYCADNLLMTSDAAIFSFGADGEIALSHVHNVGLILTDSGGSPTLQFHDANESISSDGTNLILTSGGNAFKWPTATGSNGQQLTTNGAGVLSWAAAGSTGSGEANQTLTTGTGISGANSGTTGNFTIALDMSELTDMTADVTDNADEFIILDGGADRRKMMNEIDVGGFRDVITGPFHFETDQENVALGEGALDSLTQYVSGLVLNGGNHNTAIGENAGTAVSTGDSNTLLGHDAGETITTGSSNTVVGADAEPSAVNASNQIVIGSGAVGLADNSVVLGNTSITAWLPPDDAGVDLGSSSYQFKDGYFHGTLEADAITVNGTATAVSGGAFHDGFSDFVANEHIDHSGVTITAGTGMTGGGTIAATRTLNVIGGDGITANANDVAITAAQTTITSVLNTGLVIGRDSTDQIKFSTDNQIIFRVGNADGVTFKASGEIEATKFDGALEGNADTATALANARTIGGVSFDGTAAITVSSATGDFSIGDDLTLGSDAAVINFGGNSEIKLTHVHDTGLLLTDSGGSPTLQLHDANESVSSDGSKLILTSNGVAFSMPTADGSNGQQLTTNGSGTLSWAASGSSGGSGISDIVEDTSPQLGGDLDTNGHDIIIDDGKGIYATAIANGLELLLFQHTASANSFIQVWNGVADSAAGTLFGTDVVSTDTAGTGRMTGPGFEATGSTTDVGMSFRTKGLGHFSFFSDDTTSGAAPVINLMRHVDDNAVADDDILGQIKFIGGDSSMATPFLHDLRDYAKIESNLVDVTNGSADGNLMFSALVADSHTDYLEIGTNKTNDTSAGVRAFTGSMVTVSGTGTTALSRATHAGAYIRATGAGTFTLWDGPKVGDQVVVISDHGGTTTIDGYSSDTINGASNTTITTQYNAKTFIATSSSTWIALG